MSKSKIKSEPRQWFLRTGANAEFGPIEQSGLQLWAEQARVLPGHEVSNDRVNWVAATSVEFLDMRWFIDDGDGDLKGPLNHLAAEALIRNGKFSKDARIIAADQCDEPELESSRPGAVENDPVKDDPVKTAPPAKEGLNPTSADGPAARLPDESDVVPAGQQQPMARIQELESKIKLFEKQLRDSKREQRLLEERYVSSEDQQALSEECAALQRELAAANAQINGLRSRISGYESQSAELKTELSEKCLQLSEAEKKISDAIKARESALQQSRESERSFARLLNDANKRDGEYQERIDALRKTSSLSPEEKDRFYSDQNAVFQILKREVDSISQKMELEREHLDALKSLAVNRRQELEKQRQILQNHLGASPAEMTSRVLREQTVDPNAVRLRSELDELRVAHERYVMRSEERERDLNHKLKVIQSDCGKLMDQLLAKERESVSAQKQSEKLAVSERELSELRKNYESERRQFVEQNNALAARVDDLESDSRNSTHATIQASEAKGVKLASWMSLKK